MNITAAFILWVIIMMIFIAIGYKLNKVRENFSPEEYYRTSLSQKKADARNEVIFDIILIALTVIFILSLIW